VHQRTRVPVSPMQKQLRNQTYASIHHQYYNPTTTTLPQRIHFHPLPLMQLFTTSHDNLHQFIQKYKTLQTCTNATNQPREPYPNLTIHKKTPIHTSTTTAIPQLDFYQKITPIQHQPRQPYPSNYHQEIFIHVHHQEIFVFTSRTTQTNCTLLDTHSKKSTTDF